MKVLITGSTGFIGYHVIKELLKYDCEIISTSRSKGNIPDYLINDRIRNIHCDITYPPADLFNYLDKPDILIHLAWDGLSNYKDLGHFETILPAHYRFLKEMIKGGLSHLVVTGTCFEYGMHNGCLNENMVTDPGNPYGIAKDMLRKSLEQLACENPLVFQWVRLFYMYGEGQSRFSLLSLLKQAIRRGDDVFNMSGGEQIRDYLPVEQVASNIVKIGLQDNITGIINCCSAKPVSVRTLVENYLKEINKSIELNLGYYPYPDYEPFAFWGDNRKLLEVLKD